MFALLLRPSKTVGEVRPVDRLSLLLEPEHMVSQQQVLCIIPFSAVLGLVGGVGLREGGRGDGWVRTL